MQVLYAIYWNKIKRELHTVDKILKTFFSDGSKPSDDLSKSWDDETNVDN